eukprot:Lithocolla_globosa_v1_NODE_1918_length_2260_cov_5.576417.p1 type:complete len:297 gc:universal NODE_1918_length_2260_cov_5.576417:1529-639(-)
MGFELEGFFFVCKVLPFGWKPSADIFNALSNAVMLYIRRKLMRPGQIYIDDGIGSGVKNHQGKCSTLCSANDSAYICGRVFTRAGFFFQLRKCYLLARPCLPYLGLLVDAMHRRFSVPQAKSDNILMCIESILHLGCVEMIELRSLAGKCISLDLAVPAAPLFTRQMYKAVRDAEQVGSSTITLNRDLERELSVWMMLKNNWGSCAWREAQHVVISLLVKFDASERRWGGFVSVLSEIFKFGGGFSHDQMMGWHIYEKEAYAFVVVLRQAAYRGLLSNRWVQCESDNRSLVDSYQQ